jgi:hypothetical protein
MPGLDGGDPLMSPQLSPLSDRDELRRRVAHELYTRLAFTSFVIWTGGCLILFILFAAGNPRPVYPAMMSMTAPLVPAALVWLLYRPLIAWRVARHLRAGSTSLS